MDPWYIPEIYLYADDFKGYARSELPKIIAYTPTGLYITHDGQVFNMHKRGRFANYNENPQAFTKDKKGRIISLYGPEFDKKKFADFVAISNLNPSIPNKIYEELRIVRSYCSACMNNLNTFGEIKQQCTISPKCCFYYCRQKDGRKNFMRIEKFNEYFKDAADRDNWLKSYSMVNIYYDRKSSMWRCFKGISLIGHFSFTWFELENFIQDKIARLLERIFLVNILGYSGLVTYNGIPIVNTLVGKEFMANQTTNYQDIIEDSSYDRIIFRREIAEYSEVAVSSFELAMNLPARKTWAHIAKDANEFKPTKTPALAQHAPAPQSSPALAQHAPAPKTRQIIIAPITTSPVAPRMIVSIGSGENVRRKEEIILTTDHFNLSIDDVIKKIRLCDSVAAQLDMIVVEMTQIVDTFAYGHPNTFNNLLAAREKLIDLCAELKLPK